MKFYAKGLIAGFLATIVLSLVMLANAASGMLPGLNVIHLLAGLTHQFVGTPVTPIVGWVIHFLIGTVLWGLAFAWLAPSLPGRRIGRGLIFATGAWILMMIILMPLAGLGLFGLRVAVALPVATLILHWIYGAVLGYVFGLPQSNDTFRQGRRGIATE